MGGGRVPGRQPPGLLLSSAGTSPSLWRVLLSPHLCPAVPGLRGSLRGRQRGGCGSAGPFAPGAAQAVTRQPRRGPSLQGSVRPALRRLGAFTSDRRLEPFRPMAAAGSEPGLRGAGGSRGSRRPYTEIRLAGGCCGSVSTRAEGEGLIILRASRAGRPQTRQKQSPGRSPSSAGTRWGRLWKHPPRWARRAPERATSRSAWTVGTVG